MGLFWRFSKSLKSTSNWYNTLWSVFKPVSKVWKVLVIDLKPGRLFFPSVVLESIDNYGPSLLRTTIDSSRLSFFCNIMYPKEWSLLKFAMPLSTPEFISEVCCADSLNFSYLWHLTNIENVNHGIKTIERFYRLMELLSHSPGGL